MAKLIQHLQRYYLESIIAKDLLKPFDLENELVLKEIFDNVKEYIVSTSLKELSRYEKEFGLPVNSDISLEERRNRVRAKMRGTGTITVEKIKDIIRSWSGCEVSVIESESGVTYQDQEQYTYEELEQWSCSEMVGEPFVVRIIFTDVVGIPPNLKGVYSAIDEVIPAHIVVKYEFQHNTNSVLKDFTHGHLSKYTHYQLNSEEIK